jgi:hypothetical protein
MGQKSSACLLTQPIYPDGEVLARILVGFRKMENFQIVVDDHFVECPIVGHI